MNDLEAQVERGQASLGRLIRQFCIVNEFKHVQLMQMANSLTGIRWLHSSQISTLKRGAAKNLTGFPLYSLALVNKRIWEVNNDIAKRPPGTRPEDWLGKKPMLREDQTPSTSATSGGSTSARWSHPSSIRRTPLRLTMNWLQ